MVSILSAEDPMANKIIRQGSIWERFRCAPDTILYVLKIVYLHCVDIGTDQLFKMTYPTLTPIFEKYFSEEFSIQEV